MRNGWTQEEVESLEELYLQHGSKWREISAHFPFRTSDSIRNKIIRTLKNEAKESQECTGNKTAHSENAQRTRWSREEDRLLVQFVVTHMQGRKHNWKVVATHLAEFGYHRRPHAVRNRYSRLNECMSSYGVSCVLGL